MNSLPFDREHSEQKELFENADDRALKTVQNFRKASEEYREPFIINAAKAYDLYRNHSQIKYSKVAQRANLKIPKAHEVVLGVASPLTQRFVATRPYIRLKGRGPEDDMFAEDITDFFDFQLDQANFKAKYPAMMIELSVTGTLIVKVPYKFIEKEVKRTIIEQVPEMDEETGMPVMRSIRSKVDDILTIFDGPDIEHVPIEDFYPDPAVRVPGDIEAMRGCGHRVYKSYEELKEKEQKTLPNGEKVGLYKNLGKLKTRMMSKFLEGHPEDTWRDEQLELSQYEKLIGKIEIFEYWGRFSPDGKQKPKEMIITIADDAVVIRREENPFDMRFKPFIACPNTPIPGEFYGDGDIKPIESLIRELTALRNARLDQVNINVNGMHIVDRNAGINLKTLTYKPGGIILADDINGIKPLRQDNMDSSAYKDSQQLDFEIQSASGLFSPSQNTGNIGRAFSRTATGVSFLSSTTGSRIEFKATLLDALLFKRLGWILQMHARQFVDEDQYVRVSDPNRVQQNGAPFSVLPADAFFRVFDFAIESNLGANFDFEKMQTFIQFLQVAENTQPGTVKFDVVLNEIGRILVGNKTRKFVRSDQERMQMMQMQMMQQQMNSVNKPATAQQAPNMAAQMRGNQ